MPRKPGDEVLFYFSGHGVNLGDKGNYYILLDAKDQDAYIREQRRKPGSARELDTQDKENKRYEQYLTETALSEVEIERAIKNAGADVVIIIADACRVQLAGSKALDSRQRFAAAGRASQGLVPVLCFPARPGFLRQLRRGPTRRSRTASHSLRSRRTTGRTARPSTLCSPTYCWRN